MRRCRRNGGRAACRDGSARSFPGALPHTRNLQLFADDMPMNSASGASPLFPEGLRGVVFDCDGVIINSRDANNAFYNRVLAWFGLPPMTREQEDYVFMATGMQSLCHILPERLHGQIDYVVRNVVVYDRDIVPLLRLQPGLREFLDLLKDKGLRLAAQTNRTRAGMQRVLDIFDLHSYFYPVITATDAAPKPSPEGARHILDMWHVGPRQALFVGDSRHDKDAAGAAGMVFAAFNGGALSGDVTAADYPALADALRETLENL